jgi:hypothetical protein
MSESMKIKGTYKKLIKEPRCRQSGNLSRDKKEDCRKE